MNLECENNNIFQLGLSIVVLKIVTSSALTSQQRLKRIALPIFKLGNLKYIIKMTPGHEVDPYVFKLRVYIRKALCFNKDNALSLLDLNLQTTDLSYYCRP